MKFKFRAEPKDIMYFLAFCVFLLYLVALGVLNLSSLAQTTEFYGFNPIMAFSPTYIIPTFVFFIAALVGIILSAASYFWDRDKGFGFETGKSEKGGYSRWGKDDEIRKKLKEIKYEDPNILYAGVPLSVDAKKGKAWVDDGESHTLIIGSTGSGKTRRLITPLIKILSKKGESMILTDPKGEIYEENSAMLISKGYNIVVLNLRNPEKGNAWNPLTLPYKLYKEGSDKANELLADLGRSLLHDEKADDPFWQNSSSDYFTALALGLFEDAKEEEINLNSISYMSAVGEEKFGSSNYAKEYFMSKDPSKPTYINASGTVNAPQDTKNSILSVFRQKIKIFATTEHLSEMLSYSDFDMKDIGRKKTAVFIIIQDEKKTYHALATVFIKQCYETLIDVAQENSGKLPIRTNYILDEFANMPPLKDVTTMVTAARSRQIRFNFVIQNFAQLNQVYGKEDAETIKGNCSNLVYLMSKELQALEEISKLCGEKKVKEKDGKEVSKPLINISELQRLKMGEVIIIKDRSYPIKTKLPDQSEYNFNEPKATQVTYPVRQTKPISLFDVREFVKQMKMNSLPTGNMFDPRFMGMGGNNPSYAPNDPRQFMPPISPTINPMSPRQPMQPNMPNYNNDFFNNKGHNSSRGGDEAFNVDDLIKKIDAKIAELEAEEKRENAMNALPIKEAPAPSIPNIFTTSTQDLPKNEYIVPTTPNFVDTMPVAKPIKEEIRLENIKPIAEEEPKQSDVVNISPDIDKIINSNVEDENTDDQFFDDFFSDDE